MNKRISITLIALLLVSSVLTACGGPAPVTFSAVPVFTGATETANELLSAGFSQALSEMKTQPEISGVEGKAYDLPEGTSFDALAAFYKGALEKGGWTVGLSANPSLGYTRGKQGLNITYMEGVGMMVMLSTLK